MDATKTRRSVKLTIAAWIGILILTGAFQFYRDAISDAVVFLAMAAALIVGRTGILRRFDGHRWQPRRAFVVVTLAVAAAILILTPRHGIADGIIIAATGIIAFIVAWPDPPADDTASEWTPALSRSALAWALLGLVFCVWELAMYFLGYNQGGRTEYPALSDLLDPMLDNPIGRAAFAVAWLAGGVALARRGRTKQQ